MSQWMFWLMAAVMLIAAVETKRCLAGESIPPKGSFDGPVPQEWTHSSEYWWGFGGDSIKIVEEKGRCWLRLENKDPSQSVRCGRRVRLKPGWDVVVVKVRMRATGLKVGAADWETAALSFDIEDEAQRNFKGVHIRVLRDTDWKEFSERIEIPAGAFHLHVLPSLYHTTGVLEIDDLRLEPEELAWDEAAQDAALPGTAQLHWGEEPVEELSGKRGRICLNGIWQFVPSLDQAESSPSGGTAFIRVPGSWKAAWPLAGLVSPRGKGPAWKRFGNGAQTERAWYMREVRIPASWKERAIVVGLQRVSTDAVVFANGRECGAVSWPRGEVDISSAVKAGEVAKLWIRVAATARGTVTTFLDAGRAQTNAAALAAKGLIGDVFLSCRPQGPRVSDVFAQTSTRRKELKLEVELRDLTAAGAVQFLAQLVDEKGFEEQRFQAQAQVKAADRQTVTLTWNWEHPRLWDFAQPNLYTLKLAASGAGLNDEYPQVFGFREFWIEGRSFFLNGTEIRLRPSVIDWAEHCIAGNTQLMDAWMDGLAYAGFNCHEIWPKDHDERGSPHYPEAWAERADKRGWLLVGPALSAIPYVGQWNNPGAQELWEERMADALRDLRNHPSVLLWSTSPNYLGHGEDQDPRYIGRHKEVERADWKQRAGVGRALVAAIKRHDPSRPVLLHAGGPNGDVYSANTYLNLLPLQEREEWLTEWAQSGDLPYLAVEFGTPFDWTFLRGRWGQSAATTEPFFTEYCAIYLGSEAYAQETSDYRQAIRRMHQQGDNYQSWQNTTVASYAPDFQKLEALFITNTYRSWRTFGISGGMIPWSDGFGWDVWGNEVRRKGKNLPDGPLAPFKPGQRGTWTDRASVNFIHPFRPEGMEIYPAGQALMQSNGPALAWICGPAACFTAKDHNFAAGQNVEKQVALVNDERSTQDFSFSWEAFLQEKKIAQGGKEGRIETAKALFFPVQFQAPSLDGLLRAGGRIELKASIGKHAHEDTFHFGVFSKPAPAQRSIAIFDPVGKTKTLLASLGYGLEEWKGEKTVPVLVVAASALSKGQPLPGDLEAFVMAGGRAIIFEQNPDWLQEALGFRVAPYLSRRVFPIAHEHPVVRGLEAEDLWDWGGVSDLVQAYPLYGVRDPMWRSPDHGWHWGNRGAVSSAAIEKPHRSSWRPILECEFDLAYSPLLELDYGKGRLTLCTLDLESHASEDPVAALLAGRIVEHAATADLAPKAARVLALGTSTLLDELGVVHRKDKALDPAAELVVVGAEASVDETALRAYLEKGGKVLFLEQEATQAALGVKLARVDACAGSLHVPNWLECRGLSASDLRWRTEHAAWLIQDGAERGADGLLGRIAVGQGVALFCQIDPRRFDTTKQPYFRLTRWRQTRALAQLLANMGATFQTDQRAFQTVTNVSTPGAARNLPKEEGGWYHPDYRQDFEMGDDPYRYFRW